MNKKQLRDAIADAILYANQQDAEADRTRPMRALGDSRRIERLT